MQELQLVYWRVAPFNLDDRQSVHFVRPVWMHSPEFLAEHGDGWEVISCNIAGSHESGDVIMAATMTRDVGTGDTESATQS